MTVEALSLNNVGKKFGALAAVSNVSLKVMPGERRAVIGPNGAGKTTLFNLISGTLPVSSGTIAVNGQDVTALPDWKRVRLGLARTFQRNNLFLSLTVYENVRLAVQRQQGTSFNLVKSASSLEKVQASSLEILEQVNLTSRAKDRVANLSYGEQRQLEVALALATEPALLLLDEPTAGMSVTETRRMLELIQNLPPGLTLLIVEHDMEFIFALASYITVLHLGQVLTEGTPEQLQADAQVRDVYLGQD